ncbi:MAG: hypothetical protein ACI4CY_06920 [Candidatus Gastranaerophilaceae bacterium]
MNINEECLLSYLKNSKISDLDVLLEECCETFDNSELSVYNSLVLTIV